VPAPLTDRTIRALKPDAKQYEVADAKTPGLALRVQPSGTKAWAYRYRIGSAFRRISLGVFPEIGLKKARDLAADKLFEVKKGRDPSREKRELREAEPNTFRSLVERYLDDWALGPDAGPREQKGRAGIPKGALLDTARKLATVWTFEVREGTPRKRTWKVDRHLLDAEIPKSWRQRSASEITRRELHALFDAKARTAPIQANRIRAILRKLFAFAVEREIVPSNPVRDTPKPGPVRQRDRVLTEDEIREFWQTTETLDAPMRAFFRLRLVTAQRGGEVNTMRWSDLDLDNTVWTIPAERAKNGLSHRVPLTSMALEILAELPRPLADDFVLAGARGKRQQSHAAKVIALDNFIGHDLRRTAASLMAGAGVPRLHIGMVLNHAQAGVTSVYDRHSYDPEKRIALDTWARKLTAIVERADRVAPLPFARRGER
jgi:integrase